MKKNLLIAVVLFLVFVVSAVVHTPAQVIYYFKDKLPRNLQISQVTGSIWHGKAMNVQWQQQPQTIDLGSVAWNINWTALLSGKLSIDTRFGQNSAMQLSGKGQLEFSGSDITISSMMVRFPVESIAPFIPSPVPFTIQGLGSVNLKNIQLKGERCIDGDGVLQWDLGMVNVFSQSIDLGLVKSTFVCQNGKISVQANQSSEMFHSQVMGALYVNHQADISGSVRPLEGVSPMLSEQLKKLPEAENGQGYVVKYQGRW